MKNKVLALSLLLSAISISLFAQPKVKDLTNWNLVVTSSNGDVYFLRNKAVSADNQYVTIWAYCLFKKKVIDKKTYTNGTEMILYKVDCHNNLLGTLETIYYNSSDKIIEDYKQDGTLNNIVPDSIGEAIEEACKKYLQ